MLGAASALQKQLLTTAAAACELQEVVLHAASTNSLQPAQQAEQQQHG
jgi:hypothetical protein